MVGIQSSNSLLQVQQWISAYGYSGIFFLLMFGILGLPIPDETLLLFFGYLISRGTLHPIPAFFSSFLGSASGISLSYLLGRLLGVQVVLRFGKYVGIHKGRLETARQWFTGIGHWALVAGYFVPGVRHLTAIIAGISNLETSLFMAYAYLGALLWVSVFLSLGFLLGEKWLVVSGLIHEHLTFAMFIIGAVVVSYIIVKELLKSGIFDRGKP